MLMFTLQDVKDKLGKSKQQFKNIVENWDNHDTSQTSEILEYIVDIIDLTKFYDYSIVRLFLFIICRYKYGYTILNKLINKYKTIESFINSKHIINLLCNSLFHNFKVIFDNFEYFKELNKNNINELIRIAMRNNDDRVFKFIINTYNKNIFNKKYDKIIIYSNIFLNLNIHPDKYILRRLKYIEKYLDKNDNTLISTMINTTQSEHLIKTYFKYYYTENNILINSCFPKLIVINDINTIQYIYEKLNTVTEKEIYSTILLSFTGIVPKVEHINFSKIENIYFVNMGILLERMVNTCLLSNNNKKYIIFNKIMDKVLETISKNQYYDLLLYQGPKHLFLLPYLVKHKFVKNNYKYYKLYYQLKIFCKKYKKNCEFKKKIYMLPLLNEIKYLKPNNNIPVMDEKMFFFNDKIKKKIPPPRHILLNEFEMLENILIREKPDGIFINNIPKSSYPYINHSNNIKAEYIEHLDLYLVFDIDIDTSPINRYNYLRNLHYKTKDTKLEKINNMNDLKLLIDIERIKFKEFLEEDYDSTRWYPKIAFHIENTKMINNDMCKFINNGDKFFEEFMDIIYDGFIITPLDESRELKIKPKKFMTIDLEYRDSKFYDRDNNIYEIEHDIEIQSNNIYRCYPENNKFVAKEVRIDKNKPNPYNIVNNIINLLKIDFETKEKEYYYHNIGNNNLQIWSDIVKNGKENVKKIIKMLNISDKNSVLDLGCGRGKLYKLLNTSKYCGYDIDSNNINMCIRKYDNDNITFNKVDLKYIWTESINKYYDIKYKHYDFIFAINSLMHFSTDLFWEQLNKMIGQNTVFVFNLLKDNNIEYKYNNSYLKKNDNKVELFFESIHNKPIIEDFITINNVNNYLKKYNLKIIKHFDFTGELINLYEWFFVVRV